MMMAALNASLSALAGNTFDPLQDAEPAVAMKKESDEGS
jgi:hypothetical protein